MLFIPAYQDPQNQRVDPQADKGYDQEFGILEKDGRIGAVEGPDPVEDVIGAGCSRKTYGIGNVLLDFQDLFAEIGNAEIKGNARNPDHTKLYELHQHFPFEQFGHDSDLSVWYKVLRAFNH
jgi:hypothetical protein